MKRAFILLAALLTMVSCDFNEFSKASGVGKPIVFTANTYYQNGIHTRTEYSGEFFGETTKYERIDWVDTDLMRVWAQVDASNTANGDYVVESHQTDTGNGQNSNAKVKSVANPLTWLSDANHSIYALYPSPATDNVDANKVSLNANVVTATIPATQEVTAQSGSSIYKPDMNYAYMWAATQAVPGSNVALGFKPLMTAFEFSVRTADDGAGLSSFSLVADDDSPYIAGDFTAAISEDLSSCAITSIANGSRTITVNFDNATTAPSGSLTFTIFALPQELTHLTMQFTMSDGTVKELALKQKDSSSDEYQFITFEAGTKYRITNVGVPGDGWTYTLEEVEPGTPMARNNATAGTQTKGVYSYRTKDGVTEAVEMQFRYSPADNDGGNLEQWSTDLPEWLASLLVGTHTDEQNPDDPFILTGTYTEMPLAGEVIEDETQDHIAILKANGDNGADSGNPQDLALYDINNLSSPRPAGAKTANSYVVDRAGWYMFPLVYGNAIDWEKAPSDGWNESSYYDGLGNGWDGGNYYVLHRFRNYLNTGIETPYILDDVNIAPGAVEAVIVWEDASEDNLFIKANTVDIIELASSNYKAKDGGELTTVPFIKFQVDPDNIRQGNAVIAVREKEGDKRIIWSWHIWVTDTDLSTQTVETRASLSPVVPSNQMLKVDMGWCDTKVVTKYFYNPRLYYVEVTQASGNEDPVVFAVSQTGDHWTINSISSGTFYQYGRKDPFLPLKGELMNPSNKDSYSPAGYTITSSPKAVSYTAVGGSNDGNVSYGIQNPHIQYQRGQSNGWVASQQHNLWDVTETVENGHYNDDPPIPSKDKKVVKSIYDPCPPGFSIPHYLAFTIFTKTGGNVGTSDYSGWATENPETEDGLAFLLNTTEAGGEKILFPFHGFRSAGTVYAGPFYLLNSKSSGTLYSIVFNIGGTMRYLTKSNAYHVRPIKEME